MKTVRIIHQVDRNESKQIVKEWWTIDGIGYRKGQPLKSKGFTWIKGPDGGAWEAPNKAAIQPLLDLGYPTHTWDTEQ